MRNQKPVTRNQKPVTSNQRRATSNLIGFIFFAIWVYGLWSMAYGPSVYAEEQPVTLEYRYRPGQILHYRHAVSMKTTHELPGGSPLTASQVPPQTFSAKMDSRITLETESLEKDGSAWIKVRYDDFNFSQKVGEEEIPIGGGLGDPNAPFQEFIGKTVRLHFQKDGRLVEVGETPEGMPDPQMIDQFRQMYGQVEGIFPGHPVRVGESWKKSLQLPIAGLDQKVVVDFQNTLEAFEKVANRACARIKSVLTFSLPEEMFSPPGAGENTIGISIRMDGHGTMEQYFDLAEGVVVKGEGTTMTTSTQSVTIPATEAAEAQTVESRSRMELTFKTELE